MGVNLDKAVLDIGKVTGVMCAMEALLYQLRFRDDSLEKADHFTNAFYALRDEVMTVEEDIYSAIEEIEIKAIVSE